MKLENITIVLTEPSHPGNIGSAARAMMTMGLAHLVLVAPKKFPHPEAYALASGASSILDNAQVVPDLASALVDQHRVFATSARARSLSWPVQTVEEASHSLCAFPDHTKLAYVFGRERTGLTNEELALAHCHVTIPTEAKYSSLNLAASVQVVCYALRMALLAPSSDEQQTNDDHLATHIEQEGFYQQLQEVLIDLDFLDEQNPRLLMPRLRRLFSRTQLESREVNILRGILSAVMKQGS